MNEGDLADPGGGSGDSLPGPKSGIIGWVKGTGNGAGAVGRVQIYNPGGSGVNVLVYELYLSWAKHFTSAVSYGKRFSSPTSISSPYVGALIRLDETDITPIKSFLYGGSAGSAIAEANAEVFIPGAPIEGGSGWQPYMVRGPGMAPIIIEPGNSWEATCDTDSVDSTLRLNTVFDEVVVAG